MMMRPAADSLTQRLENISFSCPKIPVIHNVHGRFEDNPEGIKAAVLKQIYSPVLWVQCVERLLNEGTNVFVECGAGGVLSGLIRRIDKTIQAYTLSTSESFESALFNISDM